MPDKRPAEQFRGPDGSPEHPTDSLICFRMRLAPLAVFRNDEIVCTEMLVDAIWTLREDFDRLAASIEEWIDTKAEAWVGRRKDGAA